MAALTSAALSRAVAMVAPGVLLFASAAVLAPLDLGQLGFGLSVGALLGSFNGLGSHSLLLKCWSSGSTDGSALLSAVATVVAGSLVCFLLCQAASSLSSGLAEGWLSAGLVQAGFSFMLLSRSLLVADGRAVLSGWAIEAAPYLLAAGQVFFLLEGEAALVTLVALQLSSAAVVILIQARRVGTFAGSYRGPGSLSWLRASFPFLTGTGFRVLLVRFDGLLIGIVLGAVSVGKYSVASRVATLPALVLTGYTLSIVPALSRSLMGVQNTEARKLLDRTKRVGRTTGAVGFIACASVGVLVLDRLGVRDQSSLIAMLILATASGISGSVGAVGQVMLLGGLEREFARSVAKFTTAAIAFGIVATPLLGLVGAALSTAVGVVGMNIHQSRVVASHLNQ